MSAETAGPSAAEMGQNPWDFQNKTSETDADRANREAMEQQAANTKWDFSPQLTETAEAAPIADKAKWDFSPKDTEFAVTTLEEQRAEIDAENRKYVWDFDPQSIADHGDARRLRTPEEMVALEAREALIVERPETVAHIGQDAMKLDQRG